MSERKRYMASAFDSFDKFEGHEGEVLEESLLDLDTMEKFDAKIMVSKTPQEGYDELVIGIDRGGRTLVGQWWVKILERPEEEEAEVTIFESKRLGARRGYMLRSMMAEQKEELKRETMTSELEKRLKRKQEIVKELLEKQKE